MWLLCVPYNRNVIILRTPPEVKTEDKRIKKMYWYPEQAGHCSTVCECSSQVMNEHFLPLVEQHASRAREEVQNTEV